MATSGTVSGYNFNLGKVIDHAFRRAGVQPEQVSSEQLEVARDLVFTLTSEWVNAGFPLWTRKYYLLNTPIGSPDVAAPVGTVDIRQAYWRIFNPYRGNATTSAGADASPLFTGEPNDTDVVIAGPNAGVIVDFGSETEMDTVGVLLGGSSPITAALQIKISVDGSTWTTFQTLDSATYTPGQWTYFDLNPTLSAQFVQLVLPSGTFTLNALNFCLANGNDIPIGPLNIDDYYNLPDKMFRSNQPNSSYLDRQLAQPVLKVWPVLNVQGFYRGTVTALARRYIQDPGELTNDVEVPQRWLEALIWRLASILVHEIPTPIEQNALAAWQARVALTDKNRREAELLAWAEERVRAPIRWSPNFSVYTR
jgi:hypothetical protein